MSSFKCVLLNRAESSHSKLKRYLMSSLCNFGTSWKRIHALLVLQHTEIKASFEKSLIFVRHEFMKNLFQEMLGFVSHAGLDYILGESKRMDYVGTNDNVCGCTLRKTHGLPCAHEMTTYKENGRPIPLDCVHYHWRKLDMVHVPQSNDPIDVPLKSLEERFMSWLCGTDDDTKRQVKRKLEEIMTPGCTTLTEPQEKIKTKGRPTKEEASTRRMLSSFEIALSGQDCHSQAPNVKGLDIKAPSKRPYRRQPKQAKDNVQSKKLTPTTASTGESTMKAKKGP